MSLHPSFASAFAVAALLGLSACGGNVAADAPALLSMEQIAARADFAVDPTRGVTEANTLQWRAARLRARADQIRRAGINDSERRDLLRRLDRLNSR